MRNHRPTRTGGSWSRAVIPAVVILAILGGAGLVQAAQVNDDPTISGTTGLFVIPRAQTLQQGAFSIGVFAQSLSREEGDSEITTIGIMGGYGLSDRLEIFMSVEPYVKVDRDFTSEAALFEMHPDISGTALNDHPFASGTDQDGFGDITVGAKYRLIGDTYEYDGLSIAGFAKLPTSDDEGGIGTGKFDFGGMVIGSLEASETIGFNGFLGYVVKEDPDPTDALAGTNFFVSNEFRYGFGVHLPTRSMLQVVLETWGVATSEDVTGAHIGGDDYTVIQGGLRLTTDSGFAVGGALNYNANIAVVDPDWQDDPQAIDDELSRWGFTVLASYSSSRPEPVTYAGTAPMPLPAVNAAPTLSCRAERTTVRAGESVRLFAETTDPDGDSLTVTWAAAAGTISPRTGTEVTWSSRDVPAGSGRITARVVDGYGGSADCELRVTVEVPPPPPEPTVLTFECTEFNNGSSRIDNRCKAVLDDVALQLRQNAGATATITGHSDSAGDAERNNELATERADNAKAYLVDTHGIDAGRITTSSAGSSQPRGDNATAAGRAQNRRIEITVTIPPR